MDINALMGTLLSEDSLQNLGKITGTSEDEVKNVLASALPGMLEGLQGQANDAATVDSFVGALSDHAKVDTSDVASFLSQVDLEDGGKIVQHLLGGQTGAVTEEAAQKAGLGSASTGSILSAAAPLLMSLLGQQTSQDNANNNSAGIGSLMGALLGNVNIGSLLAGMLGGGGQAEEELQAVEEEPKDEKPGGLLSSLLGLLK